MSIDSAHSRQSLLPTRNRHNHAQIEQSVDVSPSSDSPFLPNDAAQSDKWRRSDELPKAATNTFSAHTRSMKLSNWSPNVVACTVLAVLAVFTGAFMIGRFTAGAYVFERPEFPSVYNDPSYYIPYKGPLLLVGDSLTQYAAGQGGWVSLLSGDLVRRHDVLNRGYSGYTSSQYANMVAPVVRDSIMPGVEPALVTILLGTNDVRDHTPLDVYESNMLEIVGSIRRYLPDVRIMLMTPPPSGPNFYPAELFQIRNSALDVAKKANVAVIDLWATFFPGTSVDTFSYERDYNASVVLPLLDPDQVHFSPLGHVAVYNAIKSMILAQFSDIYS